MMHKAAHCDCVDAWMLRAAASDLPAEELVRAFEEAAGALWQRALVTLGEVTLGALFERVLFTSTEQFGFLASVGVRADGLACEGIRAQASAVPREELTAALRFVLVEMLTVVGNLTAEILTPALHAALSRVPARPGLAADDGSTAPSGHERHEGGES